MPRVKIKLADNITRVVFVETDATVGATIGTDLKLPSGQVATVAQLQALLGIQTGDPDPVDHRLLAGLSLGDDHPQYTRKDTLTTRGDLYARGPTTVQRLGLGSDRQFFRAGTLDPAWETVSPTVTLGTDLSGTVTLTNLASGTLGATIVANAVTDTKLRDSGALSVVGRSANSTGDPADIAGTADQVLRVNSAGTVLGFGTVATAGLTDDSVTDAKLRNSAGLSVVGRTASTTGDPADIAGTADQVLRVNTGGTALGFGTIATGGLASNAVTNAKLASMVQATIKGRAAAAGTGDPTDLTAAEVATIVNSSLDHGTLVGLGDDDHTQYVLRSILTTNGDLFTRTAGAVARLGIGTSLQLLRTVAGAPTWVTLSPTVTLGTDLSGNVTLTDLASGTLGATIVNDAVTDAKLRNSAALSVIGRSAGTSGDPADIAGTTDQVLRVNTAGTALGFGTIATGGLTANAVTNAKLATMAQATVKGRAAAAGTGDPTDLSATELATIVNASLDHGTLTGLGDDDHPQYAAVAQSEAIVSAWNFTARQQVFGTTTANIALVTGLADSGASIHCVETLKFHRIASEPFMIFNRVNGSYAAPTALLNGNSCGGLLFGGYQGATMATQSGFIEYLTSEDWSTTAQGGNLRFQTTIAGTTTRQLRLLLGANSTGAFAQLPSGVAAQPGWSFISDTDTGVYLAGTNSMGLATSGTLRVTLNTATLTSTLPFLGPDGSAGAPTYGWSSDTNTGLYGVGADNMGISTGGTLRWDISTTAITSTLPLKGPDGTAAATSYGFSAEATLGMYRIGTNILGFSTASTERLRIDASGAWGLAGANVGTAGQTLTSNGSGAAPTWQNATTFSGTSNTSIPAGNTIANTASETAFTSSYTIPANSLRAGSVIKVTLYGTYGTDAVLAPTLQGRLKIGGTTRLDTGSLTAVVGATNRGWTAEGQIVVHSIGASGVADAQGTAQFSTAVTAALSVHMPNTATFTLDTTASQAITVTIQWGTADTDNTITLRQFIVSISNP
jgi:hypothetical protein